MFGTLRGAFCVWFAILVSACSELPSLEQTTGSNAPPPVFITDVVKRVKCEIADAFHDKFLHGKIADEEYAWLRNWTAKADLTLTMADTAGLTPSVQTVTYFKNTPNPAAGASSFSLVKNVVSPGTGIAALSNTLTLGAGATYSEQATRTEMLSFSLSVKDIATYGASCLEQEEVGGLAADSSELVRGLGLRGWINTVIEPVLENELDAGDHPGPGSVAAVKAPAPSSKAASGGSAGKECTNLYWATQPGEQYSIDKNHLNTYDMKATEGDEALKASLLQIKQDVTALSAKIDNAKSKLDSLTAPICKELDTIRDNKAISKPYKNITNARFQQALDADESYVKRLKIQISDNQKIAPLLKARADIIKSDISVFKDQKNLKEITDSIFDWEQTNCDRTRHDETQLGKGCGVLDCTKPANKAACEALVSVLDCRPDKLKIEDKDACEALASVLDCRPDKLKIEDKDACEALASNKLIPLQPNQCGVQKVEISDVPTPPPHSRYDEKDICNLVPPSAPAKAGDGPPTTSVQPQNDAIMKTQACDEMRARRKTSGFCSVALNALNWMRPSPPGSTDEGHGLADEAIKLDRNAATLDLKVKHIPSGAGALPDPPIDSVSHQVQFIVTYGANLSPNWALAAFKGPTTTGNLASGTGIRTHILTLSLGPTKLGSKQSPEQDRAIQNLNILSIAQPH